MGQIITKLEDWLAAPIEKRVIRQEEGQDIAVDWIGFRIPNKATKQATVDFCEYFVLNSGKLSPSPYRNGSFTLEDKAAEVYSVGQQIQVVQADGSVLVLKDLAKGGEIRNPATTGWTDFMEALNKGNATTFIDIQVAKIYNIL